MSIVIRPAICLVFGMLCAVNTTHALDLDKAITLPDAPVTLPITEAKGWYLRGDISTSFKTLNRSHSFSTFSVGNSYRAGTATNSNFKENSLSGGVGIGYRFNDVFRADATVDIFSGSGTVSGTSLDRCPGALGGTNCALTSSGKFISYGLMANAYVDLATVAKFTPYVGAGIGATQVNWGEFNGTGSCIGGGCGGVADVNIKNSGLSQWRTTWALMTGVSYELSEKAKLDFGYRYSRTSSGKMFGYDSASTALGASGTQARDGGFDRHEVRVGLRIAAW
jgi:opacity protein-like surface antigen